MMLFKPYHISLVLNDTKTETRRDWGAKPHAKVGKIHLAKTQMLSREYFCKILILAVYKERLGDITPAGALAEGGYTVEEYFRVFEAINGPTDRNKIIWVVKFRRVV